MGKLDKKNEKMVRNLNWEWDTGREASQTFWHKKWFGTWMIKTRYNIISTALAKLQSAELKKRF